ncbi:MAG: UDP-N-acetylmuramoyl-L-alanine--D-glutamate ligase [Clostridiaceae bacterium]|nr:UDP-N-acetylmuramoyl-L-alanine--D-glutamate ligase [Clostridiaceae bacterium]
MKNIISNSKPAQFFSSLSDKRIAVIGAGISNRPLIRWLWPYNQNITVFDMMQEDDARLFAIQNNLKKSDCHPKWSVGSTYLNRLHGFDIIFRTPRMRPDLPELVRERERGAFITSEIELFIQLCPAPIYAVTGSDGKTTVTTLISRMLQSAGYRVFTGGNIGTPLLDQVERIDASDRVVLELSSFQLMDMTPRIQCALITNVTPNHLDFHRDFQEYIDAKKNIYINQSTNDRLILNKKDPVSSPFASDAKGIVQFFNAAPCKNQMSTWESDHALWLGVPNKPPILLCHNKDLQVLGAFNRLNIQSAALAVAGDASIEAIRMAAVSFTGVHHRLELVRELDGVRWFNSSIDSSPTRTIHTLEAMREQGVPLVLITGGQDKQSDYTGLGSAIRRSAHTVILSGQNSELILSDIERASEEKNPLIQNLNIFRADTYEEAVAIARKAAKPGDAVLLSPSGTSFDRFQNFEERGDFFRQVVQAL